MRAVVGIVLGRVTSECHNVAEASALDPLENLADFVSGVANAGKVRHDLKIEELMEELPVFKSALPGCASCAVGNGDKIRVGFLDCLGCFYDLSRALFCFIGENSNDVSG